MHVIEPVRYQAKPVRRRKWPFLVVPLVLIVLVGGANYLRPLPVATASVHVTVPATVASPAIAWPASGEAAIAAQGYGLLGTSGDQTPLATASTAKVITALAVLQKLPLKLNETGPNFTISAADVTIYNNYVAQNGSSVAVQQGEQISEYQALEALLIPSANNIADSLVDWVFGSHNAYAAYATTWLEQNGLNQTHIGTDASGFDASTTSTGSNLASIGLLALQNPVLMEVAGKTSTDLPVVGTVQNYNAVLGVQNITGLKTGNNDADPGAFLFTAYAVVGGKDIPVTGAVMNAADLPAALRAGTQLSKSLQQNFEQVSVASAGQALGSLHTAWGASASITAQSGLSVTRWKATPLTETHTLNVQARTGSIGSLKLAAGKTKSETPLVLAHTVSGPSFWWRLTRH